MRQGAFPWDSPRFRRSAFKNLYDSKSALNPLDGHSENCLEGGNTIGVDPPAELYMHTQAPAVLVPRAEPVRHLVFQNLARPKIIYPPIQSNYLCCNRHKWSTSRVLYGRSPIEQR